MTTTLTIPQVLRIAADNLEAGREVHRGLEICHPPSGLNWRPYFDLFACLTVGGFEYRLAPEAADLARMDAFKGANNG